MTPLRFIETNVLVRHIAGDHPDHAERSHQLFLKMADGEVAGLLSMTVLFETIYLLEGFYHFTRVDIARSIRFVIGAEGIQMLPGERELLDRTLQLFTAIRQLSFADCYHAVLSQTYCNGEIYTFDREFDRVPDLTRLEP